MFGLDPSTPLYSDFSPLDSPNVLLFGHSKYWSIQIRSFSILVLVGINFLREDPVVLTTQGLIPESNLYPVWL